MTGATEVVLDRARFIGGSDAAALLGLSRWRTPLAVWAEKTGALVAPDISGKVAVKLGVKLEQTVAEFFMEETGKKVRRVNETLFHPEYPFIGANIDRRVVGEESILECKTTSAWKAKEWEGEEIPREYIIQVMHYLAVTGASKAYVAVLIGNQDFKWKIVERDDEALRQMLEKEVHFWKTFIEPKVMPGMVTRLDADVLFGLFPEAAPGSSVTLGDEADKIIESRAAMIADKILLEGQIDKAENEIRAMLGENETGMTARHKITWKNQVQRRPAIDELRKAHPDLCAKFTKEIQMRVLRIREVSNG